ncbi:HAD-IA family hydrolase [Paenibacillus sp. NPDC058071]|uniref:HAD-IA family hydrolase n=1 Tax=Paenibacillus sp. NPDC058071 TaxID=3346326 RepID=UPI0036D99774
MKNQLVLDIGGVLAENITPFWKRLSGESQTAEELFALFNREVREELWSGGMTEKYFWERFAERFPNIPAENARESMIASITPLPAIKEIPRWSRYADIHLLSNHRTEWIMPIVNTISDYVTSVTISSEAGCCKPSAPIYSVVNAKLGLERPILFIDDQEKNMKEARAIGWQTLIADVEGRWIAEAERYLLGGEK